MVGNKSVILKELERQAEQGWFEPRKGIITPDLSFEIAFNQLDVGQVYHGVVTLKAVRVQYREHDPAVSGNAAALLKVGSESYAKFHDLIEDVALATNFTGIASVARLHDASDREWSVRNAVVPLSEAAQAYRFGGFEARDTFHDHEIRFQATRSQGYGFIHEPYGTLWVDYHLGKHCNQPREVLREAQRVAPLEAALRELAGNYRPPVTVPGALTAN
jgi:hypothetical protein